MSAADEISPIAWRDGALHLLDQTRLPSEERWLRCSEVAQVADAIRRLAVRGAPAIGVAAAYGLVTALDEAPGDDPLAVVERAGRILGATRPTAVNLRWALDRGCARAAELARTGSRNELRQELLEWASALHADDIERNRRMAAFGVELFAPGTRVLTHCNAGALATGGIGTAVGVIAEAWRRGRVERVWVERFGNADGWVFVFSGDFDVDEMTELASAYLGTLPSGVEETPVDGLGRPGSRG